MEDTGLIKMIVDIEKKNQENWKDCNRFHSKNLKRSVPESFLWKFKQTVVWAKQIEHFLHKVLETEELDLLLWFSVKYTITFIFTKSFLKTVLRLSTKKLKDRKVSYQSVKSTVVCVTGTFLEKVPPSRTCLLFYSWKRISRKVRELSLRLC